MKSALVLSCVTALCSNAFGDTKPPAKRAASVDSLDVRVMISSPGTLVIDRGGVDKVAIGDVVTLTLKDGTTRRGSVTKVADRSSTVKLEEKELVVPTGTRGTVALPKGRGDPPKKPVTPPAPEPGKPAAKPETKPDAKPAAKPDAKPDAKGTDPAKPAAKTPAKPETPDAPTQPAVEHPAWQNADKEWSKGMPLLSPVRPESRAPTFSGRLYSSAEFVRAAGGDSSSSYARLGGEATAENLFGDGGTLHVEGDVYHRAETDGGHGIGVLPYQLSYTWGGTRFSPTRIEVGRFLQHGMPEFGVLDGVEYTRRLADGSSLGASLGYMPEPDDDFGSFQDFQLAAYYHWVADDSEHLTATAGLQGTLHEGDRDRDLLVAKLRWVIDTDMDFHGTAWIDHYGSGDGDKPVLEVTQAVLVLSRRFGTDAGGELTFRHLAFPALDRDGEFPPPLTAAEIEDNHLDELSGSAFEYTEHRKRLHGQAGVWLDEDEKGGSADAGIEFPQVIFDDLKTDFTAFGSRGQFSTIFGGRVTCSLPAENGRWDLAYEYANHRLHDFSSNLNDLDQQRVWISRSFRWGRGWSLALNGQVTWFDTDISWSAGWYVQKSF